MVERARLTGGSSTIAPIPSIGVTDAAAKNLTDFAAGLAKIGDQAQTQLDIQAVQEGERAGIIAGMSPKFQVLGDATLRARAYDRAGLNIFVNQTEIATQSKIDELFNLHRANPGDLKSELDGWAAGFRADMQQQTPQAVPFFDASFARNTRPLIRAAEEEFRQNLQKEAAGSLAATLETSMNAAARLAFNADADPESAAGLTAERNAFIDRMVEHGPKQAFGFAGREMGTDITRNTVLTPAQMQKALSDWDEQAYSQTVMGRFARAPDKASFAAQFSDSQRKDAASPIGIAQVERIEARMRATIEAEERVAYQKLVQQERNDRLQEKAIREGQETNAVTAFDMWAQGKLTVEMLDTAGRNRAISRETWQAMRTKLTAPPPDSTDDRAELFWDDAINQGEASRTGILSDPGLRPDSARRLLDKLAANLKSDDRQKSPYEKFISSNEYKMVNDNLQAVIITTGPFATFNEGERERLARARRELDDRIKQGLDAGSLKTPGDVWAIYDQMAPRYSSAAMKSPQALPRPYGGTRPASAPDVVSQRQKLIADLQAGRISPADAAREQEILEEYETIFAAQPAKPAAAAPRR